MRSVLHYADYLGVIKTTIVKNWQTKQLKNLLQFFHLSPNIFAHLSLLLPIRLESNVHDMPESGLGTIKYHR